MTLDEFFTLLEKTPRDWFLEGDESIRRIDDTYDNACCPLTACDPDGPRSCGFYRSTADKVGMEFDLACQIAAAADNTNTKYEDLRARLLAACGLTEQP